MNDQSGRKDRISANAGRIFVSAVEAGYGTDKAREFAVKEAVALEDALTNALAPTEDGA